MDAAVVITLATWLKMVLMLTAMPGMIAPAASATKPAINAYSMRSWPRVSFQIFIFKIKLLVRVTFSGSSELELITPRVTIGISRTT